MGRGILVDLYSWRQKQQDPALKEFNCFETSSIPLKDIKACLAAQGTEVKFGDILFTRTGKNHLPCKQTHTHHTKSVLTKQPHRLARPARPAARGPAEGVPGRAPPPLRRHGAVRGDDPLGVGQLLGRGGRPAVL